MARKRAPHAARKQPPRVQTPTPPNGNGAPRKSPLPVAFPASGIFPDAHSAPMALAGAALCLLVAVSYFPALSAGFLWDDWALTKSTPLHTWSGLAQVWFAPRVLLPYEAHYWPLLYTLFWLEHKLWGLTPFGYHLVNLLLHTGVVLLLWRLLLRLGVPGAWFAAAVFAVHPLHVESVAWIIGRKDILATVFYLSSVLAYIRFAEMPRGRRGGPYLLAVALFVLGLLSKSIAITLPVALLLWHWWRHGRVTLADCSRTLPFFLVGLGIALADYAYYVGIDDPISFAYSPLERGLIAAHALVFYVGKLLWPTGLTGSYPHWEPGIGDALAWGGAAGFAAVVAALWHWRRQLGRGPLAGVLFFAVALSPVLGFVGLRLYAVLVCRRPLSIPRWHRPDCRRGRCRGPCLSTGSRHVAGAPHAFGAAGHRGQPGRPYWWLPACSPGIRPASTATPAPSSPTSSPTTRRHTVPTTILGTT